MDDDPTPLPHRDLLVLLGDAEIPPYRPADERSITARKAKETDSERHGADGEPCLIVFLYRLPDPLPVPDGTFYTFQLEERVEGLPDVPVQPFSRAQPYPWDRGRNLVSLRFWRVSPAPLSLRSQIDTVSEAVVKALPPEFHPPGAESEADSSPFEIEAGLYATVVEAVTFMADIGEQDALSAAFDRCMDKTAHVVQAYRLYSGHPVRHLSHERLDPVIPYATRSISGEWHPPLSLMLLHMNIGGAFAPEELSVEELDALAQHIFVTMRSHPLAPYAERRLDARIALHADGDYGEAVVQVQIAAEVLFEATLALMLWEEGRDPASAAAEIYSEGLAKRVRTHFHPRLGGDWNPDGNGPIAAWNRKIAKVRGRVVHAAYRPARAEAIEALQTADDLEAFVRGRVAAHRNEYPRTALLALGRPGLEMEEAWTRRIREFFEEAREEPDWLADFNAWRGELAEARE